MQDKQAFANLTFTSFQQFVQSAKLLDGGKIKDKAFQRDLTSYKWHNSESSIFVNHLPEKVDVEQLAPVFAEFGSILGC